MARAGNCVQSYCPIPPIPKRDRAAARGGEGGFPDVKAMRPGTGAPASVFGPIRSVTRRAIAGAGSMKITGQGASRSMRSSSSG
jgi:hypothetical protein